MLVIFLYILSPVIGAVYKLFDYYGIMDFLTCRRHAVIALNRLKSTAGYPKSWIENNKDDKKQFKMLIKIILKYMKDDNFKDIKDILKNNLKENVEVDIEIKYISVLGKPIQLQGLPNDLPQEKLFYYPPNLPIGLVLIPKNTSAVNESQGKMYHSFTIGDLEKWIEQERKKWDFWIGAIMVALISIASIILRLQLKR